MFDLIQVKSLSGLNFVRADKVVAIQTSATGTATIVLEGGTTILTSELVKDIALRFGRPKPEPQSDAAGPPASR